MPYFYFDLVVGEEFKDQDSMILEDTDIAFEKADSLASELYIVRPAALTGLLRPPYRRREQGTVSHSA